MNITAKMVIKAARRRGLKLQANDYTWVKSKVWAATNVLIKRIQQGLITDPAAAYRGYRQQLSEWSAFSFFPGLYRALQVIEAGGGANQEALPYLDGIRHKFQSVEMTQRGGRG